VDRYSFIASDLHRLLLADLPAHNPLSSSQGPNCREICVPYARSKRLSSLSAASGQSFPRQQAEDKTGADIAKFFDSVSKEWLARFLEHRIGDKRVLRGGERRPSNGALFQLVGIPPSLVAIAIVQAVWALPFATIVILVTTLPSGSSGWPTGAPERIRRFPPRRKALLPILKMRPRTIRPLLPFKVGPTTKRER
jgi:hypothetical protein